MTGFKPRTYGVGSDHSANRVTTTARLLLALRSLANGKYNSTADFQFDLIVFY